MEDLERKRKCSECVRKEPVNQDHYKEFNNINKSKN